VEIVEQGQRLQVFLSHAGAASRRTAENLIAQGRVSVNGITITALGSKVFSGDTVLLDGLPVKAETRLHYLALNKPAGYICTSSDPHGRPLALNLLPRNITERLYNVGRLDFQSCGLIFFTNDGNFTVKLEHPSSSPEKEYYVEASGPIPHSVSEAFLQGLTIDGIRYQALEAELTGRKSMRIVLSEGKNREIRRVFSHFHLHAQQLRRIRIGPVLIGDLKEGESRPLSREELAWFWRK
jgi:23S rRNA pseudouridine2605 synthase